MVLCIHICKLLSLIYHLNIFHYIYLVLCLFTSLKRNSNYYFFSCFKTKKRKNIVTCIDDLDRYNEHVHHIHSILYVRIRLHQHYSRIHVPDLKDSDHDMYPDIDIYRNLYCKHLYRRNVIF